MIVADLRRWLAHQPFEPFVLVTSDGDTHEIRHRELIELTRARTAYLFRGTHADPQELPTIVSLLHITTLRPLSDKREK